MTDTSNVALPDVDLTGSMLSGLASGNIDFTALTQLALNLPYAGGAVTVEDTPAGAPTTITTGNGPNWSVSVHATASPLTLNDFASLSIGASSSVQNIQGPITAINESPGASLVIDDRGDANAAKADLTGVSNYYNLSGLAPAAIQWATATTSIHIGTSTSLALNAMPPDLKVYGSGVDSAVSVLRPPDPPSNSSASAKSTWTRNCS